MHPLYEKAHALSREAIGGAIEAHRELGPGLNESFYERCLLHELGIRKLACSSQKRVRVRYKGLEIDEPLRFDILVEDSLLIEGKAVETVLPNHKAQLMTYMKLLDVPVGLLINFHETILKNGVHRMILPGSNRS